MKWFMAGIFLAAVASAITVGAVVVVVGQQGEEQQNEGQQGGSEPNGAKIAPIKALKPGEMKPPPGTPAASLALPLDYGRFRILAEGVSDYIPDSLPPPGVKKADHDVRQSDSLDEFRDHDLFIEPPYIPAGWELIGAHAETVIWDDGSHTDSMFGVAYHRPQYFDIDIKRFHIAPEGQVELRAPPAGGQDALILNEIRGHPAVFLYQGPLQVHFVIDSVLTYVEGVAIDFDELIKIADALIAQTEEAKQPTAAPPAAYSSPVPSATAVAAQSASPTPSPVATQAGPSPPPNARYIPPSELWPAVDYTEDGWPIVADELIVKFRDGVSEEEKEAILSEVGAQSKDIYEYSDIRIVKVDPAQREQILEELSSNENIEIVEPNPIAQPDISH